MTQTAEPSRLHDLLSLAGLPLALAAAAESMAGALLAGTPAASPSPYLFALASAGLFSAGSMLGHYFDRGEDDERHPDRPLPAGRIEPGEVWSLALVFLVVGVLLGTVAGRLAGDLRSTAMALTGVVLAVVLHAALTKGIWGAGFVTIGLARGLNLLLGMTAEASAAGHYLPAALPVTLFGVGWAILRCSRQPGAPPSTGFVALLHIVAGLVFLVYQMAARFYFRLEPIPLVVLLLALLLPRVVAVQLDPRRPAALEAVQYGFLALPLLEASLATGYAGLRAGLLVAAFVVPVYLCLRRWPIGLVVTPR